MKFPILVSCESCDWDAEGDLLHSSDWKVALAEHMQKTGHGAFEMVRR